MTDYELLEGMKCGNSEAIKTIQLKYCPQIRSMVKSNSGDENDANIIEQDVLVHLFEKVSTDEFSLNENTKLGTYLFAVGRNIWLKSLRSKGRTTSLLENESDGFTELDFENDSEDDDKIMEVIEAMKKLGETCQKILDWYYFERVSMKIIAERLGMPAEATARKRKYKCFQRLKKLLTD